MNAQGGAWEAKRGSPQGEGEGVRALRSAAGLTSPAVGARALRGEGTLPLVANRVGIVRRSR